MVASPRLPLLDAGAADGAAVVAAAVPLPLAVELAAVVEEAVVEDDPVVEEAPVVEDDPVVEDAVVLPVATDVVLVVVFVAFDVFAEPIAAEEATNTQNRRLREL